jgi:hypothetical protein
LKLIFFASACRASRTPTPRVNATASATCRIRSYRPRHTCGVLRT